MDSGKSAALAQPSRLLADVGYDGEHHHEFLYHELGVLGIIPPQRGRPPNRPSRYTRGFFHQLLKNHWPVAEYGQRWQVETDFSMLKRLLGAALRSRKRHSIDREIALRVLTLNLMILWHLLCCFQQSKLRSFVEQARRFFDRHADHPATQAAVEYLDNLLKEGAAASRRSKLYGQLDRLYQQDLRGREALEIVAGVWLFAYYRPRSLPDDQRLTFMLAHALLRARSRTPIIRDYGERRTRYYRRSGAKVRRALGEGLRQSLGGILRNMTDALEAEYQQRQERARKLLTPFSQDSDH